jgi:glycosyltransferase involved in cell wall biosynthesis
MADVVFAIPGDIATPTGGYAYDRRVMALLPEHGVHVSHLALPGSFPEPTEHDLATTARLFAATTPDAVLLIDGLAGGALPAALIDALDRRYVALVHHPLGVEHGLRPDRRAQLIARERHMLLRARMVVVTSAATGRLLHEDFGIANDRIAVAEPGVDPAPRVPATRMPPRILAVGAVSPRKGFDILVDALARVADLPWQATIAGSLTRNPAATANLRLTIAAARLQNRIALPGAVDDAALARLYAAADLFVMPSLLEGYGMALTEAMARGLPAIATVACPAALTVPDPAVLKVLPGDPVELAAAIRSVLCDPAIHARLREASWQAGQALPRWSDTARHIADVVKVVAA